MNKLMSQVSESQLFSESYKQQIYDRLEDSDIFEWRVFAEHNLQDYCNDVLEEYNLWAFNNLSHLPADVDFFYVDTGDLAFTLPAEECLDPIIDIWLQPNVDKQSFINQLHTFYDDIIDEDYYEEDLVN